MKKEIRLTSHLVIFILTGVIYMAIEVSYTSILPKFTKKYSNNPISEKVLENMHCVPGDLAVIGKDHFEVKRGALIGSSSLWMFLLGGVCGMILYVLYKLFLLTDRKRINLNIFFASLIGTTLIAILELIVGLILNCHFKFFIWDYTNEFLNIMGQVSFRQSAIYFILVCPVAFWFFDFLEEQYKDFTRPISVWAYYRYLLWPFAKSVASMVERERYKRYHVQ